MAAAELIKTPLPNHAALVILPNWVWLLPQIEVGRKGRSQSGGRLLLPVRVTWNPSPILVIESDTTTRVHWDARGMGWDMEGVMALSANSDPGVLTKLTLNDYQPSQDTFGVMSRADLISELERLADQGVSARWRAIWSLEPYIQSSVARAHHYVSSDVNPAGSPLLDPIGLEQARDHILIGEGEEESTAAKLVSKGVDPSCYLRVDPERHVAVEVRRAAQTVVRSMVGDPPVGSRIRAAARSVGVETLPYFPTSHLTKKNQHLLDPKVKHALDRIVEVCAQEHPSDRIGYRRIREALLVEPQTGARTFSVASLGERGAA